MAIDPALVETFLRRTHGLDGAITLHATPLRGGLVSDAVAWVRASVRRAELKDRRMSLVAKYLTGSAVREAFVYEHLAPVLKPGSAPRLLRPVLVDWARARVGSSLEDVASWLQSLGLWEDGRVS